MSSSLEAKIDNLLSHIRGTLLYCAETGNLDAIKDIATACQRALTGQDILGSVCNHEADPRVGIISDAITEPSLTIESWRYENSPNQFGKFACLHCSVVFIAGYDLKSDADYSTKDIHDIERLVLLSEWDMLLPVSCPDCAGTGQTPSHTIRYTTNDKINEYTSTSCDLCSSSGRVDPKKLTETLAERKHLDDAIE